MNAEKQMQPSSLSAPGLASPVFASLMVELTPSHFPEMPDLEKACAALCPWCGERVHNEKAKAICRSALCRYRIVECCCE